MARQNTALLAFNRGEVSKTALVRIDAEKLRLAAECQVNWQPFVLGPMMIRPGMQYINTTRNDGETRNIPFFFGTSDTARLELSDSVMRIAIGDALVTRPTVSTAVTNGSFGSPTGWDVTSGTTSGATVAIAAGTLQLQSTPIGGRAQARQTVTVASGDQNVEHGVRVTVVRGPVVFRAGTTVGGDDLIPSTTLDTGTHCLACTPTSNALCIQIETTDDGRLKVLSGCNIDAAGTLEVPTPWTASDLENIRYDQSGDIVYVACAGIQQRKIERRSAHGWSVAVYESDNGPFQAGPSAKLTLQSSVYRGIGILDASRPFFSADNIGQLYRLFVGGQIYVTVLGASDVFTKPVRVTGIGALRDFTWSVDGVWVGTITLQQSFDGPDSGFVDVASTGANGTNTGYEAGVTVPSQDNAIVWYRVGFKAGNYTSGSARVFYSYTGGGAAGIVRVIGINSNTQAQIEILEQLSSVSATADWQASEWCDRTGWPDAVRISDGRVWWFGRDRAWASQPDFYTGFATEESDLTSLGDAAAIIEPLGAGPVDKTAWALDLNRLLVGREGMVESIRASALDEAITPSNFSVKACSTQGAASLQALKIDSRGVYVQQARRRVMGLDFNSQRLDYHARDLTRLNLDIGRPGFVAIDVARQPDTQEYLVRTEGQSAVLLDEPDDEVEAWWRMMTLGVIEDVCVIPSSSGIEDQVYFVVKRTVDGSTKRFVEKLASRDDCAGGSLNKVMDSFVVHDGSAASTITLAHLPNTEVVVWADGSVRNTVTTNSSGVAAVSGTAASKIVAGLGYEEFTHDGSASATLSIGTAYNGYPAEVFADGKHIGALTVASGVVTLPNGRTASKIKAFLGLAAPFMSSKLAYAAQGTALAQKKQLDQVALIGFDIHRDAVTVGQDFHTMDAMPAVEDGATLASGHIFAEYDHPATKIPGTWDTDARLCLLGKAPYPAKIGAVVIGVQTNEK